MYALPTLALVFPLLLPTATPDPAGDTAPRAAADKDCAKSVVEIDVDVETGIVHAFDGVHWTTLDGEFVVHAGGQDRVAVEIHYSAGEWTAALAADGGPADRFGTTDGVVRFWLDTDAQRYVVASSAGGDGAAAMLAMTPVVPDIIIRTDKDCPPPT